MPFFTIKKTHYISLRPDECEDDESRGLVGDSKTTTAAPEDNWKSRFYLLLAGSAIFLTGLLIESAILFQTQHTSPCLSQTPGAREPYGMSSPDAKTDTD